jgi:hypothetical protein
MGTSPHVDGVEVALTGLISRSDMDAQGNGDSCSVDSSLGGMRAAEGGPASGEGSAARSAA